MGAVDSEVSQLDAIELCGMGSYQWKALLLLMSVWFAIALPVSCVPFVITGMKQSLGATSFTIGVFVAASFLGFGVGGLFFGMLMDILGRKVVVIVAVLLAGMGCAISSLCDSVGLLTMLRFFVGMGVNGALLSSVTIMAEIVPKCWRGTSIVMLRAGWMVGSVVLVGMSYVIQQSSWRVMLLYVGLPSIIPAVLNFFFLSETPRFLHITGRQQEATTVIQDMARENGVELPLMKLSIDMQEESGSFLDRLKELTSPSLLWVVLIAIYLWGVINYVAYFQHTYLFAYFERQGQEHLARPAYFALEGGTLVLLIIGGLAVDYLPRRWTLAACFGCSGILLLIILQLKGAAALLMVLGLYSFFIEAIWAILNIYTPEAMPTTVRGTGTGVVVGVCRLGAIIAASTGGIQLDHIGLENPFYICSALLISAAVVATAIPRETVGEALREHVT